MRFVIIILFLIAPLFSSAQYGGEHIASFQSDIAVFADSSFLVTERIEYVFSGEKHGIFRYISTTHPDKPTHPLFKERYITVDVEDVRMDGAAVPFVIRERRGSVEVKMGDPQKTLSGTHTYEIVYRVQGGISYMPSGGADLYWDVTGSDWEVPMKQVRVRLSSPDEVLLRERSCYRDVQDVSGSCARVWNEGEVTVYEVNNLMPGEEMTVAQAVNRTKIDTVMYERVSGKVVWPIGIFIWFILLGAGVYRYRTSHETGRTIIPQYEPYAGVKPMYTGLLMDGSLDPRDITACIVYLAERGYLTIAKTERTVMFFFEVSDYTLSLEKVPDEAVSAFEREILVLIFGEAVEAGSSVALSELRSLTQENAMVKRTVLETLKQDLEDDLETQGFFQVTMSRERFVIAWGLVALSLAFSVGALVFALSFTLLFVGVLLLGSGVILSFARRRRTRKGFEALDHLKGFKLFLETTEKDRYAFHNAPEKSPEQFMEYLPYAIAFGVEERWAEVFKDISIPNPSWYDGGAHVAAFSAIDLTSSMGAFSTAFAASVTPSRSASSGGGFAGGGAGGGGGGSW